MARRTSRRKIRREMIARIVCLLVIVAGGLGLWSCMSSKHSAQKEDQQMEDDNLTDSGEQDVAEEGSAVPTQTIAATEEPNNIMLSTQLPEITSEPTSEPEDAGDENSSPYHLEDTVFFGDSRTLGLSDFEVVPEAKIIAYRGIAITKVGEKKVIDSGNEKITMIEALRRCKCKRVFVMFGMNELGWPYEDTFKNAYRSLIEQIKEAQPNAKIYVQGIFPMTEGRTDDIYNNDNIQKFNGYIQDVAQETDVTYIDISPAIVNEQGTLPKEGSDDGIHLNKEYCKKWMAFISDIVKQEE